MGRLSTEGPPGLRASEAASVRTMEDLALVLRGLRRREARQRRGAELTYRQLAAKAGWSHTVVAAYFTGKILPPTDRFDTLVRLLGATAAEQGELATARDRVEENRRSPRVPTMPAVTLRGRSGPRQMPADVPGFVGRRDELARLDRLLELAGGAAALGVVAIAGTAGVGKTALAVRWSHQVKHRFPHGQLYADLCGYGPDPPAPPERILDGFLGGLGIGPEALPIGLDAKAARFRSLLDRRRLLVVLDNAGSSAQVRPLLPAGAGCLVVVTSRSRLTGLVARDRAHRICLDVLPPEDAVALLAGYLGRPRAAADLAATQQLARLCAYLPVALCAAGEWAAGRPHAALSSLITELATAEDPLDLLDADDDGRTAVRTVFSWSYRQLPAGAARLFRLLGRHPSGHIDLGSAAALAGTDRGRAGRLIDTLVAANLLRHEGADHYQLHDLLHAYAAGLAADPAVDPVAADPAVDPVAADPVDPGRRSRGSRAGTG